MKKLRLIAAVAIAGAFTMLSTGAAQAYPDTNGITLRVDSPVVGGTVTTFDATVHPGPDNTGLGKCSTLTVTYNDGKAASETAVRTGHDTFTLSGSYVTKPVDSKTTTHMTASCTYDDDSPAVAPAKKKSNSVTSAFFVTSTNAAVQAAEQHATTTAKVILLPKDDGNGILPNTGGMRLSLLVIGGLLVLVGVGVTIAARRRSSPTH